MAFKNYKQFDLQSISEELLKEWQIFFFFFTTFCQR